MALGLLVLRIVAGALFAGRGAQKLFGFFGGHGLNATGGFFESRGLRRSGIIPPRAGLAELAGGALFALGLLTPLVAALMIAVMVTAIATVHSHSGVRVTNGGFEYNFVLATVAFPVACVGAGKWSLDQRLALHSAGATTPGCPTQAMQASFDGQPSCAASRRTREAAADALVDAYVAWREACARVRTAYASSDGCHPRERELAYAAHQAALDCEEHAARVYARRIDRVLQLARAVPRELVVSS